VALASVCPDGECFSGEAGCVVSEPGVECAACEGPLGSGWKNGSYGCVYERFRVQELERFTPTWNDCGIGKCLERGSCVVSRQGARCDACQGRGFVSVDPNTYALICTCYDARYDPRAGCLGLYDEPHEDIVLKETRERIDCVAHQDSVMGFYQAVDGERKYGDPKPAVPYRCIEPLGPPPGQLLETGRAPFQTCNTVGGPDPDEAYSERKDTSFKTCSYHGFWNATSRACACDANWKLTYAGGIDPGTGSAAYTCGACREGFGPDPPDFDFGAEPKAPPYCLYPNLEDENGQRRECSGHGVYRDGSCICFESATQGWWGLVEIQGIETCARCKVGFRGADCKTPILTAAPVGTFTPTQTPTLPPTRNSTCASCMDRDLGAFSLVSSDVGFVHENFTSQCCSHESATPMDRGLWFASNGTCLSTYAARHGLGFELCDLVENCAAFMWYAYNEGYAYEIYNSTDFSVAINAQAGAAQACLKTMRPTRRPSTPYPTLPPVEEEDM
jgi:hypothetical protein